MEQPYCPALPYLSTHHPSAQTEVLLPRPFYPFTHSHTSGCSLYRLRSESQYGRGGAWSEWSWQDKWFSSYYKHFSFFTSPSELQTQKQILHFWTTTKYSSLATKRQWNSLEASMYTTARPTFTAHNARYQPMIWAISEEGTVGY